MRIFLLLIFILVSVPVQSGEIVVHGYTKHVSVDHLESFTPGLGYSTDSGYRFGGLRNSYKEPSFYAAKLFKVTKRITLGLGVITGYRLNSSYLLSDDSSSVVPLIAAEYEVTDNIAITWFAKSFGLGFKFNI